MKRLDSFTSSATLSPLARALRHVLAAAPLAVAAPAAFAQASLPPVPDAGRILQELATPPGLPTRPGSPLRIEPPAGVRAAAGGAAVELQGVAFSGNTVLDDVTLAKAVGEVRGRRFDLAGLQALTERVVAAYRERGYPFVRVFLPEQRLEDGTLRITVLEGRYGRVEPQADQDWMVSGARPFLAPLAPGALIDARTLERVTLLLEDQPGIHVVPTIRPGAAAGEGDLAVRVERDSRASGEVGLDNAGSRFTGRTRAYATVALDSPFTFGDRLVVRALATEERLFLGGLDYERPLGGSGLRGLVGAARTSYRLGGPYAALDANGTADVLTMRVSYPIVRTQLANLAVSAAVVRKSLEDRADAVGDARQRASTATPVLLQFDRRDTLAGGGVTWGVLAWTPGRLSIDEPQRAVDAATAGTAGSFHRVNLDLARVQRLGGSVSFYGRLSAQWADRNLDSSEGFALGGIYGVRGYPPGEGLGARGWLAQTELRWTGLGAATPYVFVDAGASRANVRPWNEASGARRELAAAGLGTRAALGAFSVDASLAWPVQGGAPTSDTRDTRPRLWVSVGYRF